MVDVKATRVTNRNLFFWQDSAPAPQGAQLASLLLQQDSAKETHTDTDPVGKALAATVNYCLGFGLKRREPVRKQTLTKKWFVRFAQSAIGVPKTSWEDFITNHLLIPCENKVNPESFIPVIRCKNNLREILQIECQGQETALEENLNARLLWEAVESDPSRNANAQLLIFFFNQVLKKVDGGKGRRGALKDEAIAFWRSLLKKMEKHEECARGLLELILDLQRASLFCRWVAASCLHDVIWDHVLAQKDRPDVSILTYFWNLAEDAVLDAWILKARELESKHVSLHFDGIRLDREVAGPDVSSLCRTFEKGIEEETGFKVRPSCRSFKACRIKRPLSVLTSSARTAIAFWRPCSISASKNRRRPWQHLGRVGSTSTSTGDIVGPTSRLLPGVDVRCFHDTLYRLLRQARNFSCTWPRMGSRIVLLLMLSPRNNSS